MDSQGVWGYFRGCVGVFEQIPQRKTRNLPPEIPNAADRHGHLKGSEINPGFSGKYWDLSGRELQNSCTGCKRKSGGGEVIFDDGEDGFLVVIAEGAGIGV